MVKIAHRQLHQVEPPFLPAVETSQFSFSFEHFNKSNGERVPCDDDEEGQRGLLYLSRIVFSVLGKQFR
jgi:hypothetical protein